MLTPSLSSYWVNLVTPVPFGLAKPLVLSLSVEVVCRPDGEDMRAVVSGEPLPYDEALTLALRRLRDQEVATSWRDAATAARSPAEPYPGDPDWAGGTLFANTRTVISRASPGAVFAAVSSVGGERGWPVYGWAWRLRGLADRIVGGVGIQRGRRDPQRLRIGDAVDFWRVEDLHDPRQEGPDGLLRLRAEIRLPGRAWLEWRITPTDDHVELRQRALFAPRGLLGRLYWSALTPIHGPIFAKMASALGRRAETLTDRRATGRPGAQHGE